MNQWISQSITACRCGRAVGYFSRMRRLATVEAPLIIALCVVAGCSGSSGAAQGVPATAPPPGAAASEQQGRAALELAVVDVTGRPLEGAIVTLTDQKPLQHAVTTDAEGTAQLADLMVGDSTVSVSAPGFETVEFGMLLAGGLNRGAVSVRAIDEWAIGTSFVLGSRAIEVASDGSGLSFEVDVAVIDENGLALEALTSTDFSILNVDCGWGGPLDCASDSTGNATGSDGGFTSDGGASVFGILPPSPRRPFVVDVLVERSIAVAGWDSRVAALTAFFSGLGGNDRVRLASTQMDDWVTTRTVYGPFTNDGSQFLEAIDGLAKPEAPTGLQPLLLEPLSESIREIAAAAADTSFVGDPYVLVLATAWLTRAESNVVTSLARQLGVRVGTIGTGNFGLTELALRTGGFVQDVYDWRQLDMSFAAMNDLLSDTLPRYRMRFRLEGLPGTFVSGGNAKIRLLTKVPTTIPTFGIVTIFDVVIP